MYNTEVDTVMRAKLIKPFIGKTPRFIPAPETRELVLFGESEQEPEDEQFTSVDRAFATLSTMGYLEGPLVHTPTRPFVQSNDVAAVKKKDTSNVFVTFNFDQVLSHT